LAYDVVAESAGLEAGTLNPLAVKVMGELGINIAGNRAKTVAEMIEKNRRYDYVITVCDEASAERCPVLPGEARRIHWSFPDPSCLSGGADQQLAATRLIRDGIKKRVEEWYGSIRADRHS
jgi:arsenate reductase